MSKMVGVKIDTRSPKTKDKIYYYRTDENVKKGDRFDISVPSGGQPTATVIIQNSRKKISFPVKELEIKR